MAPSILKWNQSGNSGFDSEIGKPSGQLDADRELTDCLNAMAGGDYSRIPSKEGPIYSALRAIKASVDQRNRAELDRAVQLSVGASESMAAVSFVTGDVRDVDENTQTIAAAVDELNMAVSQIAKASNLALTGTNAAVAGIEASQSSVNRAIASIDSVSRTTDEAGERLRELSQSINDIGKILATIDAISKQTNLLALNATIEAARAGEAGKGFAVVAGEVKQLANQTARATEDIQDKLSAINSGMAQTLTAMDQSSEAVSAGRSDIHAVGSEIEAVTQGSQTASVQISATASSVTEQSAAIQEIARSLAIITQKTEMTRDHAESATGSVGRSEDLISDHLVCLQKREIPDAVLDLAKSDHALWKKKLARMLVGKSDLTAAELSSHRDCRLGKWYRQVEDGPVKRHPAYRQLDAPHAAVHQHGKAAAELFARGDRMGATQEYRKMEEASQQVLSLLETLKSAR